MSKQLLLIDRFEGNKSEWAVIEFNGEITFNLPRALLPEGASEGDILEVNIAVDVKETKLRREAAKSLLGELFEEN